MGERIDDKRDCKRAHLEGWNADVAVVRLSCRLRRRKDSYLLQTAMEGDVDLKKKSWVVRRCASDVPLTRASAVNTIIRQALDGYLGQPVSTQPIHGGHSMHVIRHCFAFGRHASITYFSLLEQQYMFKGADHLQAYHGSAWHHTTMACS